MKRNNKRLAIVVGVLLLVVGVSFAFYVAGVDFLGEGASVGYRVSDMIKVQYDAGSNKLNASLNPGHSVSKGFKVTVTPTSKEKKAIYTIKLNITENTFVYCDDTTYDETTNPCKRGEEELIYRLKDESGNVIAEDTLMNKTGDIELIVETKEVESKTEYNYTIEIEFKETGEAQNHNQNKVLNGSIEVEYSDGYNGDLNILAVNIETDIDSNEYKSSNDVPTGPYSINEEKSYCEVTGEKVPNIEFYYDGHEGTFGVNRINSKGAKCYLYFDKEKFASDTILAGITVKETTPDYSSTATTDEGIYQASDGMYGGTSYYWRGAATSNHVIFANKCWRIVRINGDGSIRLIYNGPVLDGNTCFGNGVNADSIAKTGIAYNTSYNNSSYVGWTYIVGSQSPKEAISGSEEQSNIKKETEIWFDSNITGTNLEKVDLNGKFCNDRRTKDNATWVQNGSTTQYYAAHQRLSSGTKTPTLACNSNDIYTLKVGAITADEVHFAGASWTTENKKYYLYNGQYYWTMSPEEWYGDGTDARVFVVGRDYGFLSNPNVNSTGIGVRPVINLRSDTVFAAEGEGTKDAPYVVTMTDTFN